DHQEYLGNTLAEIAGEKAAIIQPAVTAIVAPQFEDARRVISQRCAEVGVPVLNVAAATRVHSLAISTARGSVPGRLCATFETSQAEYNGVCLGLRGRHQITNAATAIALAEALRARGLSVPDDAIVSGLENVRHAGRLELWDEVAPPILFDGAHNSAAARALS